METLFECTNWCRTLPECSMPVQDPLVLIRRIPSSWQVPPLHSQPVIKIQLCVIAIKKSEGTATINVCSLQQS